MHTLSFKTSIRLACLFKNNPSFLVAFEKLTSIRDLRLDVYPMNPTVLSEINQALTNFKGLETLFLSLIFHGDRDEHMDAIGEISSFCDSSLPSLLSLSILTRGPCDYMVSFIKEFALE